MELDPLTLAVIKGGLEQVAEEMDLTLRRCAFSPVISESCDMANGIYTAHDGEVIVQGPKGLPVFVAIMQFAVKVVMEEAGAGGLAPGDIFILNDPASGGSHLNDMKLVRPVFHDGKLFAMLANTAHWIDLGGNVPGNFGVRASEIFQEGFRLTPVKIYAAGVLNEALLETILANTRVPQWCYGDLQAQVNALLVGERRLGVLIERYGADLLQAAIAELRRRAEQQMRAAIADIPDGTYRFSDGLDNDGVEDRPLTIVLALEVRGNEMSLDFTGTSPQAQGTVNVSLSTAISSAYVAIKHVFPHVPLNGGCFAPITFTIPPGSLLHPGEASAAGGYNETAMRIIDVVLGALGQAVPKQVPAACFSTLNAILISGRHARRGRYVMFSFTGGGNGAAATLDGLTHCNAAVGMARSQPWEIIEHLYPVLYHQVALRVDSAGAGRQRGGFGAIYRYELRDGPAVASILGDRSRRGPFGVHGGQPGATSRVRFLRRGGVYEPPLGTKDEHIALQAGDIIELQTPGGGGYGDPRQRSRAAITRDLARGYLTLEAARREYGYKG
ncbi:MAG: hydantoinase B/oxoprolinase family protein [Candidatus Tectomicrobia bacterium]|nr:hydantoinase B/oxoprolinase family protein [Candidatus Tectomicrobia bacterium]